MARDLFSQNPLDRALGLPGREITGGRGAPRPETTPKTAGMKPATVLPPNLMAALDERGDDGARLASSLADAAAAGGDLRSLVRGLPDGDALAERANAIADEMEARAAQDARRNDNWAVTDVAQVIDQGSRQGVVSVVGGIGRGIEALGGEPGREGVLGAVQGGLRRAGQWVQDEAAAERERIEANVQASTSDAFQEARAGTQFSGGLDPRTWSLGDDPSLTGLAGNMADTLGQMVPVVVAAIGSGGMAAALAGGAQSADQAGTTAEDILRAAAETGELQSSSPYYQRLVAEGVPEAEAVERTVSRGGMWAAAAGGAVGALGGKGTELVLRGAGTHLASSTAGRVAAGTATGMIEEGTQEAAEGIAGRGAAQLATGVDTDPTSQAFGDFAMGALAGGPMGAVGSLAADPEGRGAPRPATLAGTLDPAARSTPDVPAGGVPLTGGGPAAQDAPAPPVASPATNIAPAPDALRPRGPLEVAAELVPPAAPAPEALAPRFPDVKAGQPVALRTAEGETLPTVFLRDEGDSVVVRHAGQEVRLSAAEFDAARAATEGPVTDGPVAKPRAPEPAAAQGRPVFTDPQTGNVLFAVPGPGGSPMLEVRDPDGNTLGTHEPQDRATAQAWAAPLLSTPPAPGALSQAARPAAPSLRPDDRAQLPTTVEDTAAMIARVRAMASPENGGMRRAIRDRLGVLEGHMTRLIGQAPAPLAEAAPEPISTPRLPQDEAVAGEQPGGRAAPSIQGPPLGPPAATMPGDAAASDFAPDNRPAAEPTQAQKEAGNYRKAHVRWGGLDISIENERGSTRAGTARDGTPWSVTMPAHYGYVRKTVGNDGDHLDVYVGPRPESDDVWVVDQVDADTGAFDEHKGLLGFPNARTARAAYVAGFSDGRGADRIGGLTKMTADEFKAWATSGDTTRPLAMAATTPQLQEAPRADAIPAPPPAPDDAPAGDRLAGGVEGGQPLGGERAAAGDAEGAAGEARGAAGAAVPGDAPVVGARAEQPAGVASQAPTPGYGWFDAGGTTPIERRVLDDGSTAYRKAPGQPGAGSSGITILVPPGRAAIYVGNYDASEAAVEAAVEKHRAAAPEAPAPAPGPATARSRPTARQAKEMGRRAALAGEVRDAPAEIAGGRTGPAYEAGWDEAKARLDGREARAAGVFKRVPKALLGTKAAAEWEAGWEEGQAVATPVPVQPASPTASAVAPEARDQQDQPAPQLPQSSNDQEAKASENNALTPDPAPATKQDQEPAPAPPSASGLAAALSPEKQARLDALKASIGARLRTQVNSGLDPALLRDAIEMTALYVEAGARRFAAITRDFLASTGTTIDQAEETLRLAYLTQRGNMRRDGQSLDGMDTEDDVFAAIDEMRAEDAKETASATGPATGAAPSAKEEPQEGRADDLGLVQGGERDARGNLADGEPDRDAGDRGLEAQEPQDGAAAPQRRSAGASRPRPRASDAEGRGGEPSGRDAADGREGAGGAGLADPGARDRSRGVARGARPNHVIADPEAVVGGTPAVRFNRNKAAIEAFQEITADGREPTPDDLHAMAGYTGWGSFGQELFNGSWDMPRPAKGWEERDAWLRQHLGEAAWKGAQASILNAHYTDPPTVQAMWAMVERMGFKGGRVLEPAMGIGNFFGLMPPHLAQGSTLTGIELDPTTGGMARLLYPQASISIKGYETSRTADDFYDLVIGNWPFAARGPADRRYNALSPSLHDYFFLKALDQVRPGGLVVGITSAGTMDKKGTAVRQELARKAELVTAFRLASGAFEKYAGTKVVTDLIVLRKREAPVTSFTAENSGPAWLNLARVDTPSGTPVDVNEFFAANPQNVLGRLDMSTGGTYGRPAMTVTRPADLMDRLAALPSRVPPDAFRAVERGQEERFVANNTDDRNGSVVVGEDGDLWAVRGERLAPLASVVKIEVKDRAVTEARRGQLRALVGLRKAYGALIDAERDGAPDADAKRKALKALYDAFRAEHGSLSGSDGLTILRKAGDPAAPMLRALERKDGTPAAVLTERLVRARAEVENPTVADAFVIARNRSPRLDLDEVAALAKVDRAEVERELLGRGAIHRMPGGGFEVADLFLSGNVRRRMREIEDAIEQGDESLADSLAAIRKVIPEDVPYYKIEANMGAHWIEPDVYRAFAREILGLSEAQAESVKVNLIAGTWSVKVEDRSILNKPEATTQHGTRTASFDRILRAAMNNESLTITGKDDEGKTVTLEAETKEANEKAGKLRETFKDWVWGEPQRRADLAAAYNEAMNAVAEGSYDGSFLDFPGMVLRRGDTPFSLRSHQVNAIWRGLARGRGIYAHEVGTGKTYTMAGIAVESRRYGLARKPMIVAHNANSATVAKEVNDMYPGARVLYVDNLAPDTIKDTLYSIRNDDWDAVVIPHSLLDRMTLSEATIRDMTATDIAAMEAAAISAAEDDGVSLDVADMGDEDAMKRVRSVTAKELVKARNALIAKVEKNIQAASREDAVTFEDLGVDMLLIDEAHEFKKPAFVTKMRMKGLQSQTSARALQLQFLTRYVRSAQGGRGVHVFTGTPITNTLTEMFHMMRYVMEDAMADAGVGEWDGWFNTFAAAETDVELASDGQFEPVTRLSSFVNVAELRRMASEYLDIVFADDMPEFKPRATRSGRVLGDPGLTAAEEAELRDGRTDTGEPPPGRPYKRTVNATAPMNAAQREVQEDLAHRYNVFRKATRKERKAIITAKAGTRESRYNPLLISLEADAAAFDIRLRSPEREDHPESKVNRAVRNVLTHHREHPKATQVIFMDKGYEDWGTEAGQRAPRLNVAKDIKAKLVAGGVPEAEIAIVTGSTSKEARKELAEKVNRAEVRVIIGGTQTLGVGVNMQENLRAMHHLDAPWMPGELEQRNGRGQRQGNRWNTVFEYRYMTERLDGKRWQTLAKKMRFIRDFLRSDAETRVIDGDATSTDEKASADDLTESLSEAAGDPRILEVAKLRLQVQRLDRRRTVHEQGTLDAGRQAKRLRERVEKQTAAIASLERDAAHVAEVKEAGAFTATINGKTFDKRADAGEALDAFVEGFRADSSFIRTWKPVGVEVQGFGLMAQTGYKGVEWGMFRDSVADGYEIGRPSVASVESNMRGLAKRLRDERAAIADAQASAGRLEKATAEPFAQGDALARKAAQLAAVEADLVANPVPAPAWLRQGAPTDTKIIVDGQARVVTGHRWGPGDYFVLTEEGDVPYLDARGEDGGRIYDARPWEAPPQAEARAKERRAAEPADDHPLTPADLRAVAADLNAELARSGLAGKVSARLVKRLLNARGEVILGEQQGDRITVAKGPDALGTMRHEIVHALRDRDLWGSDYGLFTQDEWRGLVRAARADSTAMDAARAAYPNLSEARQVEEAIAEMYRQWAGRNDGAGRLARAFGKVQAFLRALANALRGRGFQSKALTFERMANGTVGGRGPGPQGSGGEVKESRSGAPGDFMPVVLTRAARTFSEAKEAARSFRNRPLINRRSGITATVSGGNLSKMLNRDAVEKSSSPQLQALVVANLDHIFDGAILGWSKKDRDGDQNLARILRFFAAIQTESRARAMVKLTVKETSIKDDPNPLYTVEALEFSEASSAATWAAAALEADRPNLISAPSAEDVMQIARAAGDFNAARSAPKERRAPATPPRDDAGRFRAVPWTERLPIGSGSWAKGSDYFSDLLTNGMAGRNGVNLLALVPGRALLTELGRDLMAAKAFQRAKEEMDALRNEWHGRMDEVAQEWLALRGAKGWAGLGLTPRTRRQRAALEAANDEMMDLMHEATLAGVDPSSGEPNGNPDTYAALRARFLALPERNQAFFARVRDGYGEMADAIEEAVVENIGKAARMAVREAEREHVKEMRRIEGEGLAGEERTRAVQEADEKLEAARSRGEAGLAGRVRSLRAVFESNRLSGPYFPLARFGNFFVTARDEAGKVVSFSRHESAQEQRREAARLAGEGHEVETGKISEVKSIRDMVSPTFVAEVEGILGQADAPAEVMDAVWQRWIETLPDLSLRKSRIHRKGTEGFDRDALRAFTSHVFHGAHQLARLRYGLDLQDAVAEAEAEARRAADPTRAQIVVEEIERRRQFAMNPQGASWAARASTLAYIWHLGASPAAAVVNLSQTTVIGPAILGARFRKGGVSGAVAAIAKAGRDYGRTLGKLEVSPRVTLEERAALAEALRRGTIDRTQAHDLASVAETGVEYNGRWESVMRKVSWAFHQAEVANRTVTFLAAYRMGRAEGVAHEDAIEAAADLTWKTHFDYQNTSRPRFMQQDIPKVLTIFRQYSVNLIFRLARDLHQSFAGATPELRREARTQFTAISLSMMAHAGIKGVWGYGIITTLLGMFFEGGDDDVDRYLQEALLIEGEGAGATAWNFGMGMVLNGIPGQVTGLDLNERMGSPNLWFREQNRDLDGEGWAQAVLMDLLGPAVGLVPTWGRALSLFGEGEWWRSAETALPKAVRDIMKAGRYGVDGVETLRGDPILDDVDWTHVVKQALGFTPADVAERYEMNTRMRARDGRAAATKSAILADIADAVKDEGAIPEAIMERLLAYNRAWPEDAITGETIRRSIRARRAATDRYEGGLLLSKSRERRIREEEAPPVYG